MGHLSDARLVQIVILCLALMKWAAQVWLDFLNTRYARAHASAVPEEFRDTMSFDEYSRSIEYTFARSNFHLVEISIGTLILLTVVFSGVLPEFYGFWSDKFGSSAWASGSFLFAVGVGLSL